MRPPTRLLALPALALFLAGCEVEEPISEPEPVVNGGGVQLKQGEVADPLANTLDNPKRPEGADAFIDQLDPTIRVKSEVERGNPKAALDGLEKALAENPKNVKALRAMAQLTQSQAMKLKRPESSPLYIRSAQAMRALRDNVPRLSAQELSYLPTVFYNEATSLALTGDREGAMRALTEANRSGFQRLDMLETDPELDALRQTPEFVAFLGRLESEHAQALLADSKPFPFDFRLPDLDGKQVKGADFRGKVTLIDFWGTWCPPCRKEVPHLVELYKRYHDKGLEIVGLNYENEGGEGGRQLIRSYAMEAGIPYPCLIGDEATRAQVREFAGFPTTLLLDREGKVRLRVSGYQTLNTLEVLVKMLLDEAPAPRTAAR